MIEISAILCAVHDTTAKWNSNLEFVPKKGEIVIYTDYGRKMVDGVEYLVPAIKIGDGLAYLVDLPFVGESDRDAIMKTITDHINNNVVHITAQERARWNNKLDDAAYLSDDESLIIKRNAI